MSRKKIISPASLPDYGIAPMTNDHRKRLEEAGKFPKRVAVTARTHGYVEDEIQGYLESKIAERDNKAA